MKNTYVFKSSDINEKELKKLLDSGKYEEYIIPGTNEKTGIFYDKNKDKFKLRSSLMNLLDEDSYISSYSGMYYHQMLVDIMFIEKRNSTRYGFEDKEFGFEFNKIEELNEEHYFYDGFKKIATKEKSIFDFLKESKNLIDKDGDIHQFGGLSYRIENIGDVNQHKIREYCEETKDEDMFYLGEFFGKFIEFYKENNIDVGDNLIDFGKMKNLRYFKGKEYEMEDYLKLKLY